MNNTQRSGTMANSINIIDDSKPSLFSDFKFIAISNFICHESTKTHFSLYKKRWVPETFFEFAFNEYKKYAFSSSVEIRNYFKLYSDSDISSILTNYMNSEISIIDKKKSKDGEHVYHVNNENNYLEISLGDHEIFGFTDKKLYSVLNNISNHINNRDELVSIKDLYEKFLLKKYIRTSELHSFELKNKKAINQAGAQSAKAPEIATKKNEILVGEKSVVPSQKGKVVKMFFPKLALPSAYPTSQEKSRVNSERKVSRLLKTDAQVALINKYKFNAVSYSRSFIEKRKVAQKNNTEKKKFDFDF